ncbi:MAG: class I SAM-dependent methyltransferase [Gammaproteobacteria bacterium]|nr:class I SAM-dependent methyltransferase [Gammaproteobacteria bacterium]
MNAEAPEVAGGVREERDILLKLYDKSVLKQAKHAAIAAWLPDVRGKTCLDVGADNGVLSYLLRQRGGEWYSADLDARVVESIQRMVGDRVYQFDGGRTGFADRFFDVIVIIDFLEHIDADKKFVAELRRIIKPDGMLIVNVPHYKPRSPIRLLRLMLGLTDEKHGHVRPGYTKRTLTDVLGPEFAVRAEHTYSKFFVELIDAGISFVFDRLNRSQTSQKGVVVTGEDMRKHAKKFRLFAMIYPIVWGMSQLDRLLFFAPGYSLIVKAEPQGSVSEKGAR